MKERKTIFYSIRIIAIVWSVLVALACVAAKQNKVMSTNVLMIYFLIFSLLPFAWAVSSLVDAHKKGAKPKRERKVISDSPRCTVYQVPKKFTFPWQKNKYKTVYRYYDSKDARRREKARDDSSRLESMYGAKTNEEKEYWRKVEAFYLDGEDFPTPKKEPEPVKPEALPKEPVKKEPERKVFKKRFPLFGLFSKKMEDEAGVKPEELLDDNEEKVSEPVESAVEKEEKIPVKGLYSTDDLDTPYELEESEVFSEGPENSEDSEVSEELAEPVVEEKEPIVAEEKSLDEKKSSLDSSPVEEVPDNSEVSDGKEKETVEVISEPVVSEPQPVESVIETPATVPAEAEISPADPGEVDLREVADNTEAPSEPAPQLVENSSEDFFENPQPVENTALQKEVLLGIASLSEALEHFRRYVAKEPVEDDESLLRSGRPHRRILCPDVNTIFQLEGEEKSLSGSSVSEKDKIDASCLIPVDGKKYDESRPFIEWIEEDKREVKRADDNNGEVWWDKVKVDKYRTSNPEFAYDNPFGHIFSDTVWYIDGVLEDPGVLEYVKKIEIMGGRIHRELSARCTHLLETSSGDETTFTKNMAGKYLLKDLSESEFMDVVSIGQCTADKNRHLFLQGKMFNVVKEALRIEEEEDKKGFLFIHQYNDRGLILTYLDGDRKKTIAWKGDDVKGFWDVCGALLAGRIIVATRPKEMLEALADRLTEEKIVMPKVEYINLVSLLGTYWRHVEKEKLDDMVYVTYALGQEPPQSDKELSDAVCSVFMATVIDRDVPVMRHVSSFVHQKQIN